MDRRAAPLLLLFLLSVGFGGWTAALLALGRLGLLPPASPGSGPAWASWITAAPWWVPAALWLLSNWLLIRMLRRVRTSAPPVYDTPDGRPPTTTTRIPQAPRSMTVPPSLDAFLNPRRLVDFEGVEQGEDEIWRIRMVLAEDRPSLRIHLDHAVRAESGTGVLWRPHERLPLAERSGLRPGEGIAIEILGPAEGSRGTWTWRPENGDARMAALPPAPQRCRLVVSADRQTRQHLYFVVLWPDCGRGGAEPFLVEESAFAFRDAWEAEAPLEIVPRWRGR